MCFCFFFHKNEEDQELERFNWSRKRSYETENPESVTRGSDFSKAAARSRGTGRSRRSSGLKFEIRIRIQSRESGPGSSRWTASRGTKGLIGNLRRHGLGEQAVPEDPTGSTSRTNSSCEK